MTTTTLTLEVSTERELDVVNLTDRVQKAIEECDLSDGLVTVFVPGSTAAVTTTEFEPGVFEDLPAALERIAPKDAYYKHHETWGDDNGRSHVRASIIGPDITVPFRDSKLLHGTWQQIVLVELDTRPRKRTLYLQIVGD
jgi:secondary thiamine-phosphate synthase enzyme